MLSRQEIGKGEGALPKGLLEREKRKGALQCPMLGGGEERWRGGDEKKEGERDGRVPPLSLGVEVGKRKAQVSLGIVFPLGKGKK